MKGKIIRLDWKPGKNVNSSRGNNKYAISRAKRNADFVQYNGYGNYSVIEYSKYYAKFVFEDGSERSFDIKRQVKEHFGIDRMTPSARDNVESLLPLDVDVTDYDVTFLS